MLSERDGDSEEGVLVYETAAFGGFAHRENRK